MRRRSSNNQLPLQLPLMPRRKRRRIKRRRQLKVNNQNQQRRINRKKLRN
jgi:hypothetical protein